MSPAKRRAAPDPCVALIIDDDADARRMYSEFLRTKGWVAFTAADGRSGIDKTIELIPDVIVLDIAMPRVDGWTVLKHVRDSSWTAKIAVVVVSAVSDVRDQALEAGCDAYLSKPCTPGILWLQIQALMRFRTEPRLVRRPASL